MIGSTEQQPHHLPLPARFGLLQGNRRNGTYLDQYPQRNAAGEADRLPHREGGGHQAMPWLVTSALMMKAAWPVNRTVLLALCGMGMHYEATIAGLPRRGNVDPASGCIPGMKPRRPAGGYTPTTSPALLASGSRYGTHRTAPLPGQEPAPEQLQNMTAGYTDDGRLHPADEDFGLRQLTDRRPHARPGTAPGMRARTLVARD